MDKKRIKHTGTKHRKEQLSIILWISVKQEIKKKQNQVKSIIMFLNFSSKLRVWIWQALTLLYSISNLSVNYASPPSQYDPILLPTKQKHIIISSDPPFKDGNAWLPTVLLKPSSDQNCKKYCSVTFFIACFNQKCGSQFRRETGNEN